MQTKSSQRLIQWALLASVAASLATACVVSEGDGDGDGTNIFDGGESSGNKAGKGGTGGSGNTAGKPAAGGMTATAGSTAAGGDGGGGSDYDAGLCYEDAPIPSVLPECNADDTEPCRKCMKAKCCDAWQTCYGTVPRSACGWGANNPDEEGQYDCIRSCFLVETAANNGSLTEAEILRSCDGMCLNQCDGSEVAVNDETSLLVECAHAGPDGEAGGGDDCSAECFPAE